MRYFIYCIAAVFLFTTVSQAQQVNVFEKHAYKGSKGSLPYRLLKPLNLVPNQSYPLIIFLHGAGERGDDNETQIKHIEDWVLNTKNREKFPCYVLAPQCPKEEWWARHAKMAQHCRIPR